MAACLSWARIWRSGSQLLRCPVAVAQVSSGVATSARAFQRKPLGVEDLPKVSFLELVYRLVFQGFYKYTHKLQIYEKQRYGPIYRDGLNFVSVNTPKLIEEVLRNDDKYPCRGDMSTWTDYRDMKGLGYGPLTENGEKWYNLRKILNKRMLHQKESVQYGEVISDVVTDFTNRVQYLCQCSPTGDMVTNIAHELQRFSLESIASILFETRLGCLEKEIPADTQDFINDVVQMLTNNIVLNVTPKWSRNLLPYWGRYIASWDGIFSFAKKLIDKKMEAIQQCVDTNQEVKGEYLSYLLRNPEMSTMDVYSSITELLLGGVDSTSNALTWTLYMLSREPQIQERLYREVSTLVPADRFPSAPEFTQMPYLKAFVKETLRMYPVIPINARIITEKSISVGGYQFPEKTSFLFCHYAISHDEDTFPEPFTFKPERWLRERGKGPNPFGSIPFGFGVRGCVGRRLAELEMYMLLFRLVRQFEVKPDPAMGELKSINRTLLVPERPLNLRFVKRRCDNAA